MVQPRPSLASFSLPTTPQLKEQSHGLAFSVHRDHELAAIRHTQWPIVWATAVDGNVLAILQPA